MTCKTCNGRKKVIVRPANKARIGVAIQVDCPDCKGTGKVGEPGACPKCNGSKKVVANMGGIGIEVDCPECSAPVVIE